MTKITFQHFAPLLAGLLFGSVALAADPAFTTSNVAFFEEQVKPILQDNCFKCHGAKARIKSGLRLTSRASITTGGDHGPAIDVSSPASSLLLKMINYTDDTHEMPPTGKLPQNKIDILTQWINRGAPWTAGGVDFGVPPEIRPVSLAGRVSPEAKKFWSFQPIANPAPPKVSNKAWATNPIDAFVFSKLRAIKLVPNGPASGAALIRRATYDLIGLPPTPQQVKEFVNDNSSASYEKLIDRLLASPRYGEKWGRTWLDLVRFAETNSYERDNPKPNAWRYRDYVINSFNDDKPYDQFITEQLAGDELPNPTHAQIIATGYYRLGLWDDEPVDPDQAYYDYLDDLVTTTANTFLGLTLNCARCHDHKIDPSPQSDYYSFMAFFHNIYNNIEQKQYEKKTFTLNTQVQIPTQAETAQFNINSAKHADTQKHTRESIKDYEKQIVASLTPPQQEDARDGRSKKALITKYGKEILGEKNHADYTRLILQEKNLKMNVPALPAALAIKENGPTAPDTFVLIRGSAHAPGAKVEPSFPDILGFPVPAIPTPASGSQTSGRRTILAEWMTSRQNPLTARVIVNRVWQQFFGNGIVKSASDFGFAGDKPTHPQLLDYLANDFMTTGWSFKTLHKKIMLSRTYRMSSAPNDKALAIDPTNNLIWRHDMRRLTAEEVRDSILALNGTLNTKMHGPGFYDDIPAEVMQGQSQPGRGWGDSTDEEKNRRSVYIHVKRSLISPFLQSFDLADPDTACPTRFVTTLPTQSLALLNSDFAQREAAQLTARLFSEVGEAERDRDKRVSRGLALATQRTATKAEVERGKRLIQNLRDADKLSEQEATRYFALTLLNLNEFMYID